MLGGDFGLDVLFQVLTANSGFDPPTNGTLTLPDGKQSSNINTLHIPVITLGPIGIQVGWFEELGPERATLTDITLGPSLGAGALGFNYCFNEEQ